MRRLRWTSLLLAVIAAIVLGPGSARAAEPSKEDVEFFEKKIRPVLADKCYSCHSVQAKANKKLKGKLYLDSIEGMTKGGDSEKPALVAGDPDKSLLIVSIRYTDKDTADHDALVMPPRKSGKDMKLPDEVIKDFETWVKKGAPAPAEFQKAPAPKAEGPNAAPAAPTADASSHWSFQPPREPKVPEAGGAAAAWAKSDVDKFVGAKLAEKGLTPSAAADKRTLIRRVTFDLTGLPPTPDEVAAFEADASPEAFEKVVDRLLASPRYGERWGRHWLDVARYADTKGYVFQEERRYPYAYTYRDWVIEAINADLPYDQFLVQQIAADRLDLKGDTKPLAAMGFLTVGRRFLNQQPDVIDDRIDVVCRGTMALTVSCARCHDHKYDPVSIKEYYGLYGVFASSTEPKQLPLLARTEASPTPASLAFDKELKAREAAVEAFVAKKSGEILAGMRSAKGIADYLVAVSKVGDPEADTGGGSAAGDLSRYMAGRWRVYLNKAAAAKDPVFSAWRAYAAWPGDEFADAAKKLTEQIASTKKANGVDVHPLVAEAIGSKPPASLKELAERYGALLAKFDKPDALPDANEEALRQVVRGERSPYSVPEAERTNLFKRDSREELTKLRRKVDELQATHPAAPPRAMVMNDAPNPHDTNVFIRGNPANPGSVAPRRFLAALTGGKEVALTDGSGRLQLAQAIASRDNPLTARVMVNRVWLRHFGSGIVRTPSDFGLRADAPTHPELLDYLALRFVEDNWSLKKLHKRMLLTATYQQASDDNATARAADPENLLLWRQNRQRLDFESMRDALVFVTGKLDETRGGKPVQLADANVARRTVYGYIDRQNLPGMFRAFDFASPDMHSPQRSLTTVPQQALFFMNSPFVTTQAKRLVERPDVTSKADKADRIRSLYRLLYGREATTDEIEAGAEFVAAEESAGTTPPPAPAWQYGVGRFDSSASRVVDFKPLPHFTGTTWQGGPKVPDRKFGWALLTAHGGHPGDRPEHAVVRRWTAAVDGTVTVRGVLEHPQTPAGDGVRGRIVSSRAGALGEWIALHGKHETVVEHVTVQAGDTLDFVTDNRGGPNCDGFSWAPTIQLTAARAAAPRTDWSAAEDFAGPPKPPAPKLTPWEKYAQVLLEANEFVFVD